VILSSDDTFEFFKFKSSGEREKSLEMLENKIDLQKTQVKISCPKKRSSELEQFGIHQAAENSD
jgi:hypothetical protein